MTITKTAGIKRLCDIGTKRQVIVLETIPGTEKYLLLSDDGYIIHTEISAEAMRKYTEKNFAGSLNKITEDFSQLYADERGTYITANQLKAEFSELSEDERNGRTAAEYISDCMSVNGGTLTAVNG